MVGLQKERLKTESYVKTFVFDKFQLLGNGENNALYALGSKNCGCINGILQCGACYDNLFKKEYGDDLYYGNSRIFQAGYLEKKLNNSNKRTIIILQENNKIALFNFNTYRFVDVYAFKETVKMLQFTDKNLDIHTLFYGEKGVYEFTIEGGPVLQNNENVKSACVLLDRVFYGYQGGRIVFTAPGEVFKYSNTTDDSGELYLGTEYGEIVKMIALDDSVYIFFENAIQRLRVAGSARDFVLERLDYAGETIVANSVVVKGRKIYFLSKNNGFCLQESGIRKLENMPEGLFVYEKVKHVVAYQDCLIFYGEDLSTWTKYFVVQDDGQAYEVFNLNGFAVLENRVCISTSGMFLSFNLHSGDMPSKESYWFTSRWMDFGNPEKKIVKKLTFEGEGQVTVTLNSEGGNRTYTLDFTNGAVSIEPLLKIANLQFHFVLSKKAKLKNVRAQIEFLKRR